MRTYAFLTSKSWRVEATAPTARKAFTVAKDKLDNEDTGFYGSITKSYITYDKDGLASLSSWRKLR
jgi:hypothetical protein